MTINHGMTGVFVSTWHIPFGPWYGGKVALFHDSRVCLIGVHGETGRALVVHLPQNQLSCLYRLQARPIAQMNSF